MSNPRQKPSKKVTAEVQYGISRLVNKKTGKLASKTNWLLDLAAVAVTSGDASGICTLLPQEKATKFLKHNKLENFKPHSSKNSSGGQATSHRDLRILARSALPELAVFYLEKVVRTRKVPDINHKGFRAWLMAELATPDGILNKHLRSSRRLSPLAELKRGDDWWRTNLKTESKLQNTH